MKKNTRTKLDIIYEETRKYELVNGPESRNLTMIADWVGDTPVRVYSWSIKPSGTMGYSQKWYEEQASTYSSWAWCRKEIPSKEVTHSTWEEFEKRKKTTPLSSKEFIEELRQEQRDNWGEFYNDNL